jgi:hypothetical protein
MFVFSFLLSFLQDINFICAFKFQVTVFVISSTIASKCPERLNITLEVEMQLTVTCTLFQFIGGPQTHSANPNDSS